MLLFPVSARPSLRGYAMRISVLVLLVSSSAAAVCQSATPAPVNSQQQQWPAPPQGTQLGRDFTSLPPQWHMTTTLQPKFDAQVDSTFLVHPPPSSLGEQPQGTLWAQNLYPGLQLLPVDGSTARAEPIPITWPQLRFEKIPTTCTGCKMVLVENSGAPRTAKR